MAKVNKLTELIAHHGKTINDISKATGIDAKSIRNWNFGNGEPSEEEFSRIKGFLETGIQIVSEPETKTEEASSEKKRVSRKKAEIEATEESIEVTSVPETVQEADASTGVVTGEDTKETFKLKKEKTEKKDVAAKKRSTSKDRTGMILKKYGIAAEETPITESMIGKIAESVTAVLTEGMSDLLYIAEKQAPKQSDKLRKLYEAAEHASDEAIDMAIKILEKI